MSRRGFLMVGLVVAVAVLLPRGGTPASASTGTETDIMLQIGQTPVFLTPSGSTTMEITDTTNFGVNEVRTEVSTGQGGYIITMAANDALAPGDYAPATAYSSYPQELPLLELNQDGALCAGDRDGRFRIQALTTDAQGTLTSFSATFETDCNGTYIYGEIRYNVAGDGGNAIVGPQDMWWPYRDVAAPAVSAPVTVSNPGPGPVTMDASSLSGPNSADDTIAADGCAGVTLQAGNACQISVSYKPLAAGDNQATLTVPEQGGAQHTVLLHGTGWSRQMNGVLISTHDSTHDEYIGQGNIFLFKAGGIPVTDSVSGHDGLTLRAGDGAHSFEFSFGAAPGQPFVPGEYDNAEQGGWGDTHPYIAITGNGRACFDPTGRFEVRDISVAPNGTITRLWITYMQRCQWTTAPLMGELRYNEPAGGGAAIVLPTVITWPTAETDSMPVTVPVTVWNPGSAPVQIDAASISGPDAADDSIATDGCAGHTLAADGTCSVSITYEPLSAGDNQASLAIPEHGGTTHTVALAGSVSAGLTEYSLQSSPGENVGHGRSYDFVPRNASFNAGVNHYANGTSQIDTYWFDKKGELWEAMFTVPAGQQLTVGTTYTDTTLFGDGGAKIDVFSADGCNTATGQFTITDLALDPLGNVERLSVQFVQYCDPPASDPLSGPALRGTLNYQVNFINAARRGTKVNVSGEVSPNAPGSTVTVTLQRKRSSKWVAAGTKQLRLGKASDYRTSFRRPKAKKCRAIASFASSTPQLASSTIKQFGC